MNNEMKNYYEMEFTMLKDAHFQTSQKIITFFQYALLIFSAPLALLTSKTISNSLLGVIFMLIGIIEQFVIAYLTSLRAEALLYARQINRIRSVLYSEKTIGDNAEVVHNRKILFSQDQKPDYKDPGQFVFAVIVLGLFSAFYCAFGLYRHLQRIIEEKVFLLSFSFGFGVLMMAVTVALYKWICLRKENGTDYYIRGIGVDIDGVLNKHEKTFARICNLVNKTDLDASKITTLPVHDSGIITLEQEQRVFRIKEYWAEQIPEDGAGRILTEEVRNKYGYKVFGFTWRDWEVNEDLSGNKSTINLKKITRSWLKKQGIRYTKIVFEKGNIDRPVSAFQSKYRTRYYYSKKLKLRFFIEDSVPNAIRLSRICEYVFLFNHQYNEKAVLPYNVIRVSNWDEILNWIKKMN